MKAKNAADLKGIALNVGKEVVAARNDDTSSVVERVEEAGKDIAEDVAKGAQKAGDAVEAHPELLLEYVFFFITN